MDYDMIQNSKNVEFYRESMDKLPVKKNLDKFRGCLIGGAAGDALGYAVEFLSEPYLFGRYGNRGITEYELSGGLARFSDDTQMTMLTANGLLNAVTQNPSHDYIGGIKTAYQQWLKTQNSSYSGAGNQSCWIMNVPGIYAFRGPGNTCLSAIAAGCNGTVEHPINDSKGCGGVMRVAPIGLYFDEAKMEPEAVDRLGAEAAALTHGHEMGYIPAAMQVHIIRLLSHNDEITLKEAVLSSMAAMERLFPKSEQLPKFLSLIGKAIELAESRTLSLLAIHQLGEGWCGDEALAIAIYCALKFQNDFDKAIRAAVNHGGDSDSTGAITGNILGAYLGLPGIPMKYTEHLELLDVLTELADDLYYGCPLMKGETAADPRASAWEKKYVYINYRERKDG